MKSIIELAEQAGFEIDCCSLQWHERIERFAHLVRQQALEEAAQECENQKVGFPSYFEIDERIAGCANAIRALKTGETK
jgi:hypothetical protein